MKKLLCKILGHRWGFWQALAVMTGTNQIDSARRCKRCRVGDFKTEEF